MDANLLTALMCAFWYILLGLLAISIVRDEAKLFAVDSQKLSDVGLEAWLGVPSKFHYRLMLTFIFCSIVWMLVILRVFGMTGSIGAMAKKQ